jgi:hypothetical protein
MHPLEKYKIKSLLHKAKLVKGRTLTKKERSDIVTGYLALKNLGIYDKPEIDINRKLLDKHW